jgi:hypothetical protein
MAILPTLESFVEGDPDYDDAGLLESFVEQYQMMINHQDPRSAPDLREIIEEHMDLDFYHYDINTALKDAVQIWRDWQA